jgi:hypothetical protein
MYLVGFCLLYHLLCKGNVHKHSLCNKEKVVYPCPSVVHFFSSIGTLEIYRRKFMQVFQ